jgi:class III poly(R)-hydroxyalkanoic acid synthase PhaE subunit
MAEKGNSSVPGYETLLGAWLSSAASYWDTLVRMGFPAFPDGGQGSTEDREATGGLQDAFRELLSLWSSMTAFGGNDSAAMSPGMVNVSEALVKTAQSFWEGQLQFMQQWLEGSASGKERKEGPERMVRAALKAWTTVYEQEFSRLFHVPQLGLTRVYQERANRAMDSFHRFQGAVAELLFMLLEPMHKAMEQVQETMDELERQEGAPESLREQYKLWIKFMEGQYMTMYQSEEYSQVMNRALEAYEAFAADRREVMQDMLTNVPVPTQREMDDLYREVYELKKRLRRLERNAERS